jgi:FMN phosphatase YigB (HAD superfamily)
MMNPKLLILDLDGTLYHQTPVRILNALKILFCLTCSPSTASEIRIVRRYRVLREVFSAQWKPIAEVESVLAAEEGMTWEEIRKIRDKWMVNRQATIVRIARRRWLLKNVQELQQKGVQTAILSDYPIPHKISQLRINPTFTVCSEDKRIKFAKPHPSGVQEIIKLSGCLPAEILFIGDREDRDGAAALIAGVQFLLVGREAKKALNHLLRQLDGEPK